MISTFSHTITLGSLILFAFIGVVGLFVLFYGARWKSAYETEKVTSDTLREGREAYQLRAERLAEDALTLQNKHVAALKELGDKKVRIAELEALPNLSIVLKTLDASSKVAEQQAKERTALAVTQLVDVLADHEEKAATRHEQIEKQMGQVSQVLLGLEQRVNGG